MNYNYTIHDCCYNINESVGAYQAWTLEQVTCLVALYPGSVLTNRSTIPIVVTGNPVGYGIATNSSISSIVTSILGATDLQCNWK